MTEPRDSGPEGHAGADPTAGASPTPKPDAPANTDPAADANADAVASPRAGAASDGEAVVTTAATVGGDAVPAGDVTDPADASLLALIDRLAALLDRTELSELEVQVGATAVVLRKPVAPPSLVPVAATPGVAALPGTPSSNGATPNAASPGDTSEAPAKPSVKAPLTGIWYSAPAPGSAPYVRAGGEVAAGQVIGLIEAMKLFNEIKSDLGGRVVRVLAEDGKVVKAKQPLIEVEPL